MSRRFAIAQWLAPLVVVEVDPSEFDGAGAAALLTQLEHRFSGVCVSMITPDWEADGGIRIAGLRVPIEVLASPDLAWRPLELPPEDDLPF